jgi:hypothetical protein
MTSNTLSRRRAGAAAAVWATATSTSAGEAAGGVFGLFGPWICRQVRTLNQQEQQGAPTCDARLTQK